MAEQQETITAEKLDIATVVCGHLPTTAGLKLALYPEKPFDHTTIQGQLTMAAGKQPVFIVIRRHIANVGVGAITMYMARLPGRAILVADYVNAVLAEKLKSLDIWFLDTVGNAYISQDPVYIFLKGNKAPAVLGERRKKRAFQTTGLKLLFAYLCDPDVVNTTYRTIARKANVAIGTVNWVNGDLRSLGFLMVGRNKQRKLIQADKLFERWVEAYPDQLRPDVLYGHYTATTPVQWSQVDLKEHHAYMGGETAADALTHYLSPEIHTFYLGETPMPFQITHKLRNDKKGKITLLKAFWGEVCNWSEPNIAHPILVYADLLATGDPRNIETAQLIYKQYIEEHLSRF